VAISFQPQARQILFCDFRGFEVPEMVKRRPVLVLAAHDTNSKLVVVVPLSTTAPQQPKPYHCRLRLNRLSYPTEKPIWAKCDMVAVVSTARLDRIPAAPRGAKSHRKYQRIQIDTQQFDTIRRGVAHALGLSTLLALPHVGAAARLTPPTSSV
jgi:uncharacterized protein YifN (PemK superfamily)